MRQLATHRGFFDPPKEFASRVDSNTFDLNRILMLALEKALAPPIIQSRSTFQPMRVIVINPGLATQPGAGDLVNTELVRSIPRTLPAVAQFSNHARQFSQRAVRGEILSDEHGRLYEKLGRQIRPIHQLASGPSGEVLDLVPTSPARLVKNATPPRPNPAASTEPVRDSMGAGERQTTKPATEKSQFAPLQQTREQINPVIHRKLFADPGQWRVVWWGEFKEILARQLAHPERLRDTYRLPCYVQVIETEREVSIAELAAVYKSEKDHQARLYLLTEEVAAKLDLVLPLRPAPALSGRRAPHVLAAHERVFRLLAANDPTIDVATLKGKQPVGSKPDETKAAKDAIPNSFMKEWEFKISREEALYDLSTRPTLAGAIRNFFRRMRIYKTRNEITKWQTLLSGRSGDDQLWAVRPPADMLNDPFVCDWAIRALDLAGYDSQKMFREWQIFWRRKSV